MSRGKKTSSLENWAKDDARAETIMVGSRINQTPNKMAQELGIDVKTVDYHLHHRAQQLGYLGSQPGRHHNQSVTERRRERTDSISAQNLEVLIADKICPPHFKNLADHCRAAGIEMELVRNFSSTQLYNERSREDSLQNLASSRFVRIRGSLCLVLWCGKPLKLAKQQLTPYLRFAVRRSKTQTPDYVVCVYREGVVTVPMTDIDLVEKKEVTVYFPVGGSVHRRFGHGNGEKVLSQVRWIKYTGFPAEWLEKK